MFKRNIGSRAQIRFRKWYRLCVQRYEYVPEDEKRRGRLEQSSESNSVHLDSKVTLGILGYSVSKPMWLVQEAAEHIFDIKEMEVKFAF